MDARRGGKRPWPGSQWPWRRRPSVEPDELVANLVQGLAAAGQRVERALEHLGAGVEERPQRTRLECLVLGLAVLVQQVGDAAGGQDAGVEGADGQVVDLEVGEAAALVGLDPPVHGLPARHQLLDGSAQEHGQVAEQEAGVFAADLDLAGKRVG